MSSNEKWVNYDNPTHKILFGKPPGHTLMPKQNIFGSNFHALYLMTSARYLCIAKYLNLMKIKRDCYQYN